ncbi:MAG TPA: HigA family addiction module antitoxin [Phycisphaerae bacterium]|nr:HigA family addiction module antitoxin [Phycisphaerae bacterium]
MPRRKKTLATHPGEILRTEFMEPLGVTAYQLAKALHLPGVYEIVRGKRSISADVALRLGKYFGMTPQFWMNLQTDYDLRVAAISAPLNKVKPRAAARSSRRRRFRSPVAGGRPGQGAFQVQKLTAGARERAFVKTAGPRRGSRRGRQPALRTGNMT